jgi:nucleolar GTP-binding protein
MAQFTLQGRKRLEEAFQQGKHALDDLVNVAKVLTIGTT